MSRGPQRAAIARRALVFGAAVLLLGSLTWPLLFTHSGFAGDWNHHLWLMWHQSIALESGDFPSFFLNSSYSVFYPTYAFYGGTVYAVGGLLSLLLGAPVAAYVLIYVLDFAAAFGGWYWLGRMAGVGRWLAMIPGLVFISSAYYILVAYPQGDWPEFTAISMISLMLASGLSVLCAKRLRIAPALALAISSILFFGSHNLTIMLGLTTLVLASVAVLLFIPDARQALTRRGIARVGAIAVPGAMVSAWYLLPTIAYHSSTRIDSEYGQARAELTGNVSLVGLGHLFTFSRTAAPGMSLPALAIVWVLAAIVVLPRTSHNRTWVGMLLICSGISLLAAIAMTHPSLLLHLPRPYTLIQYSYRLEAYVLLGLCGAILAALVWGRDRSTHVPVCPPPPPPPRRVRVWVWMAIPVCAVSLGGAIYQISEFPYPGTDRYTTLEYFGEVETGDNRDFQDVSQPVIPGQGLASVSIPPASVHGDHASFLTSKPRGTLLATNIGGGSNLVAITGAKDVGVDSQTGNMVIQVGAATDGQVEHTISVATASSLPIVLGRALTILGLAILALELLVVLALRLRARLSTAGDERAQRDRQREVVDRVPL
jgi:uncharacterized membrane protein